MDVDEFLAHHGVLGMKWGKRKAVPQSNRSFPKSYDAMNARSKKEHELKALLVEDLYPGKKFVNDLLKDHQKQLTSGVLFAATTAAGVAFMSYRIHKKFQGITISPIPLG